MDCDSFTHCWIPSLLLKSKVTRSLTAFIEWTPLHHTGSAKAHKRGETIRCVSERWRDVELWYSCQLGGHISRTVQWIWMCCPLLDLLSVCIKRSHSRRNSSEHLSQASIQFTDTSNQPLINKIDQAFLWVFSFAWTTFVCKTFPFQKGQGEPGERWTLILSIGPDSFPSNPRASLTRDRSTVKPDPSDINCMGY